MLSRRRFLGTMAAGSAGGTLAGPSLLKGGEPPRRPAKNSPSSPRSGTTARTPGTWPSGSCTAIRSAGSGIGRRFDVVSAYVDQMPEGDLSRPRAEEFGFQIYPDDRRGAALRRRQAGRRCRADHRRARQLSGQRIRPEEVSALRVLQAGRRRLSQGRPDRAGLQRQAPVVEVGVGQGDGRHVARAEVPVPAPVRRCR